VDHRSGERGYAAGMTGDSLRTRLLQTLEAARVREGALLALCDDSPPSEAGRWTAKDNIAHLSVWREHATRTLDAVRLGKPVEGPANESDLDARNAEIYEAHRGDSAATVRAAASESYAALIAAAQAVEHYEMTRYGTLIAWAKQLGHNQCVSLLEQTLEEEKETDKKLTELSKNINFEAAGESDTGAASTMRRGKAAGTSS